MRTALGATLVLLAVSAVVWIACSEETNVREADAVDLAERFHNAAVVGDVDALLQFVDYPFNFDNQEKEIRTQDALRAIFEKRMMDVRRSVHSARFMEVVSHEQLLAGKPVAGRSMTREQAERQAEKISLRPGGVLVRCYYADEGRQEDGRYYILVMHENALGDLKVTTYYD